MSQPDYIFGLFANPALLMTRSDQFGQVLPQHVQLWMGWLLLIGASALILAYWFREARYVAMAYVGAFAAGFLAAAIMGAENYVYGTISLLHALFWTPIYRCRAGIAFKSLYGAWLTAAMTTMVLSLIVDWKDAISYLLLVFGG
jgi:uncharacterized membrane protein (DUF485 family)